jgi:hypothetical protein
LLEKWERATTRRDRHGELTVFPIYRVEIYRRKIQKVLSEAFSKSEKEAQFGSNWSIILCRVVRVRGPGNKNNFYVAHGGFVSVVSAYFAKCYAVRAACGVASGQRRKRISDQIIVISNFKLAPDKNPMQSSFDSLSNPGPPFDY